MPHVVYVDHGDHYEVIADYSLSPRHARLDERQWQAEYQADPAYAAMRQSQAGSKAGIMPKGSGRWSKDWASPHLPQSVSLALSARAKPDFDGVPAVLGDGATVHEITVKKTLPSGVEAVGEEPLRATISAPVGISRTDPRLSAGRCMIDVGPCAGPCDVVLTVADPSGTLGKAQIRLRFL